MLFLAVNECVRGSETSYLIQLCEVHAAEGFDREDHEQLASMLPMERLQAVADDTICLQAMGSSWRVKCVSTKREDMEKWGLIFS
jgi:hypothetical protein